MLWQDSHFLVVDKPHFLPVMPGGKYVQETVLVRLKRLLGCEGLSPIHRIDRETAGLVLFSKERSSRDAYQALFRQQRVHKGYECIAPWNPTLSWPVWRESRLAPGPHFMQQVELAGIVNTRTRIEPLEVRGTRARYALWPVTGKRHQLRVHMAALGLAIEGDTLYPTLQPERTVLGNRPLQLLAKTLEFTDPLRGVTHRFTSNQCLQR